MRGTGQYIALETKKERAQGWLVNQRYATWVLDMLKTVTENGVMCLPA